MPGVAIHLAIADQLLADWRRAHLQPPFDPTDRMAATAFRQGALGPDLGYFPGGVRILSDLAHRVRSVDLARNLVDSARTSIERAFAWGWVTHLLADRAIHPLVGRGVGEVRHGDSDRFVEGLAAPALHLRVEMGIDIASGIRRCTHAPWERRSVLSRDTVSFLRNAYERTYGTGIESPIFLTSLGRTVRLVTAALRATRLLEGLHRAGSGNAFRTATRQTLSLTHDRIAVRHGVATLALGYWNPILPMHWLRAAVDEELHRFSVRFDELRQGGLDFLDNFDLDTGRPDIPGAPTLAARRILLRLRRLGPSSSPPSIPTLATS